MFVSLWDFPGDPAVKTPRFHCGGHGFDPWSVRSLVLRGAAKGEKKRVFVSLNWGVKISDLRKYAVL